MGDKPVVQRGNGSPFVTMKPCMATDGKRFRSASGKNPFQGNSGSGAYSDIFFAGGGSTRVAPPASTDATAPVQAAAPAPLPPMVTAPAPPSAAGPAGPAGPAAPAVVTPPATTAAATSPVVMIDAPPPLPQVGGEVAAPAAAAAPTTGGSAAAAAPPPLPIAVAVPDAHSPEPASLMLIGLGLSGVAIVRKRAGRGRQ